MKTLNFNCFCLKLFKPYIKKNKTMFNKNFQQTAEISKAMEGRMGTGKRRKVEATTGKRRKRRTRKSVCCYYLDIFVIQSLNFEINVKLDLVFW